MSHDTTLIITLMVPPTTVHVPVSSLLASFSHWSCESMPDSFCGSKLRCRKSRTAAGRWGT